MQRYGFGGENKDEDQQRVVKEFLEDFLVKGDVHNLEGRLFIKARVKGLSKESVLGFAVTDMDDYINVCVNLFGEDYEKAANRVRLFDEADERDYKELGLELNVSFYTAVGKFDKFPDEPTEGTDIADFGECANLDILESNFSMFTNAYRRVLIEQLNNRLFRDGDYTLDAKCYGDDVVIKGRDNCPSRVVESFLEEFADAKIKMPGCGRRIYETGDEFACALHVGYVLQLMEAYSCEDEAKVQEIEVGMKSEVLNMKRQLSPLLVEMLNQQISYLVQDVVPENLSSSQDVFYERLRFISAIVDEKYDIWGKFKDITRYDMPEPTDDMDIL